MTKIEAGVPQGDSLSTFLFCIVMDSIMRDIKKKYKCVAFADDLIIIHRGDEELDYDFVDLIYKRHGLEVNKGKCQSTFNNGTVEFLG